MPSIVFHKFYVKLDGERPKLLWDINYPQYVCDLAPLALSLSCHQGKNDEGGAEERAI